MSSTSSSSSCESPDDEEYKQTKRRVSCLGHCAQKRKSDAQGSTSGSQQNWLLTEVKRLQKEVKRLKKENTHLTQLNWKLQETFPKMIDLLSGHASNTSHTVSTSNTSSLPAVNKSTAILESAPITSAKQTSSKRNSEHRSNITSNNAAMAALSKYLSEEQLIKACQNETNYKKIISNLMECLFTEDEMLSCSVTGINTSKQPLDGHKTNALIEFIITGFPHVTVPQVKQRMGNKLRDKRQLQIRMANVNSHWMAS